LKNFLKGLAAATESLPKEFLWGDSLSLAAEMHGVKEGNPAPALTPPRGEWTAAIKLSSGILMVLDS